MTGGPPLRIALTSYRSKPHSGGQGIYVRHLSRELARLGHAVEVLSGPPYPELDDGPTLTRVPNLDLYREPDPFRVPNWREFRSPVDALEFATMSTGAFPEPLTFSLRVQQLMRRRPSHALPDIVHDNQTLGYGFLSLARVVPVVATVHHPITIDRDLELAAATTIRQRLSLRRWYSFLRMQGRVARKLPHLLTVSESSKADICSAFDVSPAKVDVVPLGVDSDVFCPNPANRVPGRIVTTASADVPLKGLVTLLEAVAKLRTEFDVHLCVVGEAKSGGPTEAALDRLSLRDAVTFRSGLSESELVDLYTSASVAAVPSLYEGFSLPAVELMSCGVPLVASRAGALPEVVGDSGDAGILVAPGDPQQLAIELGKILTSDQHAGNLRANARQRVLRNYSWSAVARRTSDWYTKCLTYKEPNAHS